MALSRGFPNFNVKMNELFKGELPASDINYITNNSNTLSQLINAAKKKNIPSSDLYKIARLRGFDPKALSNYDIKHSNYNSRGSKRSGLFGGLFGGDSDTPELYDKYDSDIYPSEYKKLGRIRKSNSSSRYDILDDSPRNRLGFKTWIIIIIVIILFIIIIIVIFYFIFKYMKSNINLNIKSNVNSNATSFSDYDQYTSLGQIIDKTDSNYKLNTNVFEGGTIQDCKNKCDSGEFNSFTFNKIDNMCYLHKNMTNVKYNDALVTHIKKEPTMNRSADYTKHLNFNVMEGSDIVSKKLSDTILLNDINKVDPNLKNTVDTCERLCKQLWNCDGFTHNKSENSCILYSQFPRNTSNDPINNPKSYESKVLKQNTNYDTYKLDEKVTNYNETEQVTLKSPLSSNPDTSPDILKTIQTMNPEKCKESCDDQEYCSGFVINKNDQHCELHSKVHNIEDYNVMDGVNIWNKVNVNIPNPIRHLNKSNPYETVFETNHIGLDKCKKVCKDLKDCRGFDWIPDSNNSIPFGTCQFKQKIPSNDEKAEYNIYNAKEGIESYAFETKV